MRILHLSDTHLHRDRPAAQESLRRMLSDCRQTPGIDVVVVTGDLADDGSREAYAGVRDLVTRFADERGIPAVLTTGNHDERDAFAEILGSGHLGGEPVELAGPERAGVSTVGGYRIVTLDSLVPGKGYGLISQTQLDWLREVLQTPARTGTVLAFHHPPIAMDVEVQRALGLRNAAELADVVRGTDVAMILCGHFHLQLFGTLAGVPVWVTPGVVNRVDLTGPRGTERAVRGASATLVDLGGPASPMLHVMHARDPHGGDTMYELTEDQLAKVIANLG